MHRWAVVSVDKNGFVEPRYLPDAYRSKRLAKRHADSLNETAEMAGVPRSYEVRKIEDPQADLTRKVVRASVAAGMISGTAVTLLLMFIRFLSKGGY